jgi:hypothetical protein
MISPMIWLALALLQAQPEPKYELQYLAIHGRRMDHVVYDVDGDRRLDVIVTSVDFDVDPAVRWIAVYYRNAQNQLPGEPQQIFPLDERASALVMGDFLPGGGIEIGFIAPDGLYLYPPSQNRLAETPLKLLHLRTFFTTASAQAIPIWSTAVDLDGNGLHDLLVPTFTGYRIFFQTEAGKFGKSIELEQDLPREHEAALEVQRLAMRPERFTGHFIASRELPRVGIADIDGDGKHDLYTLKKDVMTYFLHKRPRPFSSNPSARARVRYPIPTLKADPKKDTVDVAMIAFLDFNQDGISDLVVTRVVGQLGLLESLQTNVYLHIGTGRGNFTSDKHIKVAGVSIDPSFVDMNNDGALDCMVSRLRTDLLSQGGQLVLFGDIPITYEIFQFDKERKMFLSDPVFDKKVLVSREDLQKKGVATVPLVFVQGDLSGDSRADMVFIDPSTEELQIMRGRVHRSGGKDVIGFEPSPFFRKRIDRHPKGVQIYDMNGDGINDIVLIHSGTIGVLQSKR